MSPKQKNISSIMNTYSCNECLMQLGCGFFQWNLYSYSFLCKYIVSYQGWEIWLLVFVTTMHRSLHDVISTSWRHIRYCYLKKMLSQTSPHSCDISCTVTSVKCDTNKERTFLTLFGTMPVSVTSQSCCDGSNFLSVNDHAITHINQMDTKLSTQKSSNHIKKHFLPNHIVVTKFLYAL